MTTLRTLVASATLLILASACAPAESPEKSDPLESFNRGVFAFNNAVDTVLIEPAAKGYRYITPQPVRTGVYNFFSNLREPMTFANALLQGNVQGAFTAFWRFAINSTVGLGGLIDVADSSTDLKKNREDFGQTLGAWGWDESTYIVLPILGPSTLRDTIGLIPDYYSHPSTYYLETDDRIIFHAAEGLSARENALDITQDIDENSLDKYATYRSLYLQKRAAEIKNVKGAGGAADAIPAGELH